MMFVFLREIEMGRVELSMENVEGSLRFGRNHAFNIFCVAFIECGCRIRGSRMRHPSGTNGVFFGQKWGKIEVLGRSFQPFIEPTL